jgi:hypothetical protein
VGGDCPYCQGDRVLVGFNDLATVAPDLATEWHTGRNELTPFEVTAGTARRVWWQCAVGHEWEARIYSRRQSGCPYCGGKTVLAGYNDLATVAPQIAADWHPTRNRRTPRDVTAASGYTAWWQCREEGHEWSARVVERTRGRGCPTCAGRIVEAGFNDLASKRPDLAQEWHPTRNQFLSDQVTAHSSRKAWWLCAEGHEWLAVIASRSAGNGCPSCANYGFNPNAPALLYLLAHRRHDSYKVGITGTDGVRLQRFAAQGWHLVVTFRFENGSDAADVERAVLRWVRNDLGLPEYMTALSMPLGGQSETFASANLPAETVVERIGIEIARREDEVPRGQ